jgi:cold shock CspA family protein
MTMRGTLTRFNQDSGIGRITSEQGMDLQVHKSSIDPSRSPLCQGQTVEFRVYYGPNGPIAENVHRLRSWFHI